MSRPAAVSERHWRWRSYRSLCRDGCGLRLKLTELQDQDWPQLRYYLEHWIVARPGNQIGVGVANLQRLEYQRWTERH